MRGAGAEVHELTRVAVRVNHPLHRAGGLADVRERLRLTLGLDIIRLFGSTPVTLYAPGFSLAWHSATRTTGAP